MGRRSPLGRAGESWRQRPIHWQRIRRGMDSNVLHIVFTGRWKYREGSCLDLATLFLNFGKDYTATHLHVYWNTLPSFAAKEPHPWGSPWVQAAAQERYWQTGYYGHRLELAFGSLETPLGVCGIEAGQRH